MIIANPIYDTIFKHLMLDLSIAKGFLSVVLQREVLDLNFFDRERTRLIPETGEVKDRVRLFRLDFIADIKTSHGPWKVLIELQKSHEHGDAHRFRAYIGEIYTQAKDEYDHKMREERRNAEEDIRAVRHVVPPQILPVIPIVIMGFKLEPDIPVSEDRMICHVRRQAFNPNAGNAPVTFRDQLAECLSHDLILIQVPYIPSEPKTELEQALSIFEQRFLCDDTWKKEYRHHLASENLLLRDMLKRLNLLTEDATVIEQIQVEEDGNLFYTNMVAEANELRGIIQEKDQALAEALREMESTRRNAIAALVSLGHTENQAQTILGIR